MLGALGALVFLLSFSFTHRVFGSEFHVDSSTLLINNGPKDSFNDNIPGPSMGSEPVKGIAAHRPLCGASLHSVYHWPLATWIQCARKFAQLSGRKSTFLQVGANDGVKNDPLFPVLEPDFENWVGLMVEPGEENFRRLTKLHSAREGWSLIQAAVMRKCEKPTVTFFEFDPAKKDAAVPLHYKIGQSNGLRVDPHVKSVMKPVERQCVDSLGGLLDGSASSIFKSHSQSLLEPCHTWGCTCQGLSNLYGIRHGHRATLRNATECGVRWWLKRRCKTSPDHSAKFTNKDVYQIDLLQIDVEGFDFEVIQATDFTKIRPRIIHFESKILSEQVLKEAKAFLTDKAYITWTLGADTIAIDSTWLHELITGNSGSNELKEFRCNVYFVS